MPDEKRYTERDLILAKREGYVLRAVQDGYSGSQWEPLWRAEARNAFPLPPQTRPRVVTDDRGIQWRVSDGVLECRLSERRGWEASAPGAAILDFIANPTEPVPDEEG